MKGGYAALDAMEGHLAERTFLVGERYTIADISLYAYTHVAHEGEFDLAPYPAIRAWLERVASQPGHIAIEPERVTVRVRFAPSPTGSLHLGNALTAVANRASRTSEVGCSSCESTTRTHEDGGRRRGGDLAGSGVARSRFRRRAGAPERAAGSLRGGRRARGCGRRRRA